MTDPRPAESSGPWVPPGGLLLHIGPHKTGTTAVQSGFSAARQRLAELGVVYPGTTPAPHGAVFARLKMNRGWDDAIPPGSRKMWTRLCAETRAASGTVVVSSEALCHAGRRHAELIPGELRDGPARIVITVRPLVQIVPSAWQEYVKSGWATTYDEFLESVLNHRPAADGPTPTFWQRHDHGRLARRWANTRGAENVAVVVADPARPTFVLEAFEDLLGLPRGTVQLDVGPSNRSLSAAESEMLRLVNASVRHELPWEAFNSLMRQGGIPALVEGRRPAADEPSLALPGWAIETAREYGREAVRMIRRSQVRVLGDLASLAPTSPIVDAEPVVPTEIGSDALDLFLDGLVAKAAVDARRFDDRDLDAAGLQALRTSPDATTVSLVSAASTIRSVLLAAAEAITYPS